MMNSEIEMPDVDAPAPTSFAAEVWAKLSQVDVSGLTKEKNIGKASLSYLSWVSAWTYLMSQYPESYYEHAPVERYDNGTVMVRCTVTVVSGEKSLSRTMHLPVMGNNLSSKVDPTTREVSDAYQRCLVKCIAMFGLGVSLFLGEDIPGELEPESPYTEVQKEKYLVYRADDAGKTPLEFWFFLSRLPEETRNALHQLDKKENGGPGKDAVKDREVEGGQMLQKIKEQIEVLGDDQHGLYQIWEECTEIERLAVGLPKNMEAPV